MNQFWKGYSFEERTKMQVPEEIVEPVRELVQVAITRLTKDGSDSRDYKRHLYLRTDDQAYHIRMSSTHFNDLRHNTTCSFDKHRAGSGLFIGKVGLIDNRAVGDSEDIQTPTRPECVDKESIFILRGIFPDSFKEATEVIKQGRPIMGYQWEQLLDPSYAPT